LKGARKAVEPGHAVHLARQQQAMLVHAAIFTQMVGDRDADILTFGEAQYGPRDCAVERDSFTGLPVMLTVSRAMARLYSAARAGREFKTINAAMTASAFHDYPKAKSCARETTGAGIRSEGAH